VRRFSLQLILLVGWFFLRWRGIACSPCSSHTTSIRLAALPCCSCPIDICERLRSRRRRATASRDNFSTSSNHRMPPRLARLLRALHGRFFQTALSQPEELREGTSAAPSDRAANAIRNAVCVPARPPREKAESSSNSPLISTPRFTGRGGALARPGAESRRRWLSP